MTTTNIRSTVTKKRLVKLAVGLREERIPITLYNGSETIVGARIGYINEARKGPYFSPSIKGKTDKRIGVGNIVGLPVNGSRGIYMRRYRVIE